MIDKMYKETQKGTSLHILVDGTYDAKSIFNQCEMMDINPVINIQKTLSWESVVLHTILLYENNMVEIHTSNI